MPNNYIIVARAADKIIGLLVLTTLHALSGKKTWIEDVIVDSNYRNQGIGSQLVKKALKLAQEKGITHINLTCKPERVEANNMYINLGFKTNKTNYFRYTFQ